MPLPSWKEWRNQENVEPVKSEPPKNEPDESLPVGPVARLNEATEEELAEIKGIGPKRLKQIMSLRPFEDENGLRKALPLISRKLIEWASES